MVRLLDEAKSRFHTEPATYPTIHAAAPRMRHWVGSTSFSKPAPKAEIAKIPATILGNWLAIRKTHSSPWIGFGTFAGSL